MDARASAADRARHELFVFARLATIVLVAALVPRYLAAVGADPLWRICAFAWLLLPLAAVVHLARTGNLVEAQLISLLSLALLTGLVVVGARLSPEMSLGWLMLLPLEAAIADSPPLLRFASLLAIVMLLLIALLRGWGFAADAPPLGGLGFAAIASPAAAYAALHLIAAAQARRARRREAVGGAERYAALAGAVGDLVLRHDRSGGVLAASGEKTALFGHDAANFIGRGFFNLVHVADRPAYLDVLDRAARGDSATAATLRLRTGASDREPQFRWMELRARRLDADVEGAATMSVVRDVSAAKTAEERLQAARAEAEVATAWKDRLLANVSHELRTPLNAILGFAEILGEPELAPRDPAKQREYAKIIHASADHLLSMVNLILDTSKIAAGTFRILPEPFALEPLIADCCDMLRLKAEAGEVTLEQAPTADVGEIVADKRACRQILLNLLANAVKFTNRGGRVVVGAKAHGDMIHIFVADTGLGIPEDSLSRLGDPFFQVRNDYDRSFEGAGLGLSLVRGLVGLHAGALKVESIAGVGTRVIVRLPRVCAPDAAMGGPAPLETEARLSAGVDDVDPLATKEKRIA
jgi:two-component system, cell cycle sensor histidine kinase DivJ